MSHVAPVDNSKLAGKDLESQVTRLDLERLKHKYTASHEATMSVAEWDKAEREYRRFLTLKHLYPSVTLVPSNEAHAIWHAHILDTRAYRMDCHAVFGRFIDHHPYFGLYGEEDCDELKAAMAYTAALYNEHFGNSRTAPKND